MDSSSRVTGYITRRKVEEDSLDSCVLRVPLLVQHTLPPAQGFAENHPLSTFTPCEIHMKDHATLNHLGTLKHGLAKR